MIRSRVRLSALVATAIVFALALIACGEDTEADAPAAAGEGSAIEQAFLQAMVPHHTSAIEMANVALELAESSEIRELAEGIIAEQESEIAQMRDIHQRLFGTELTPDPSAQERLGLPAADHEADPAEMLRTADPFDRAFVDEMVPHHMSAVVMAEAVLREAEDPEIRELAQGIIDSQKAEIEQMNAFREAEYGAPVPGTEPGADHGGSTTDAPAHGG